jgi:hypothetical protein
VRPPRDDLQVRPRCGGRCAGRPRRAPGRPPPDAGQGRRPGDDQRLHRPLPPLPAHRIGPRGLAADRQAPRPDRLRAAGHQQPRPARSRGRRDQHRHRVHRRRGQRDPGRLRPLRPPQRRDGAAAGSGPGLRTAQLRRRERRRVQRLAPQEPTARLARRLPRPGLRPRAGGGVGGRPVHAVLRRGLLGCHPRSRTSAHRGRRTGRHAHVVLRQRLHPGQGHRVPGVAGAPEGGREVPRGEGRVRYDANARAFPA